MTEYTIVGKSKRAIKDRENTEYLVRLAGTTREQAEDTLDKVLHSTESHYQHDRDTMYDFRIHEETQAEECWWNKYGTN